MAPPVGFEPTTVRVEVGNSLQLSYGGVNGTRRLTPVPVPHQYRCFLPDLAGFSTVRHGGPAGPRCNCVTNNFQTQDKIISTDDPIRLENTQKMPADLAH